MEYDAYASAVRERADLADDRAVRAATEAALITVSERLPDEVTRGIAEQLPGEVGEYLTTADGRQSFGYDEYLARVGERLEDVERAGSGEAVESRAQAVVGVVLERVGTRTSNDVLPHLSEDYEALFALIDPEEVWGPGWRRRLGQQG